MPTIRTSELIYEYAESLKDPARSEKAYRKANDMLAKLRSISEHVEAGDETFWDPKSHETRPITPHLASCAKQLTPGLIEAIRTFERSNETAFLMATC